MDVRLVATLNEASAFVTSVSMPSTSSATSNNNNNNNSDDGLWMLTSSEDDTCRLYNLEDPNPIENTPSSSSTATTGQQQQQQQSQQTFLKASYKLPNTGAHRCVFTNPGNTHALLAPRLRSDHQIYAMSLETGQFIASYHCPPSSGRDTTPDASVPWFSSLVVHPTCRGIFAGAGDNSAVSFFNAGISSPVARLASPSQGIPVVEFSHDGRYVAIGDKENVLVYDWRKMNSAGSAGGGGGNNNNALTQYRVRDVIHASRWLTDVGAISGMHFHPQFSNQLLLTTSRYVVRNLDVVSGRVISSYGAGGAAASHLPNERPIALVNKRAIRTGARFSPDGKMVSVGTCMGRVTIFDSGYQKSSSSDDATTTSPPQQQQQQQQEQQQRANPALSHVLHGKHHGAVSVTEWCPSAPLLISTCRTVCVWRFCGGD